MRTPAGVECRYFYGDYYRGKNHEECRLLSEASLSQHWTSDLCKTCPVPGIVRANACEFMILNGRVTRSVLTGFKRKVQVAAYCEKTHRSVDQPEIGCGDCHPIPPIFEAKK